MNRFIYSVVATVWIFLVYVLVSTGTHATETLPEDYIDIADVNGKELFVKLYDYAEHINHQKADQQETKESTQNALLQPAGQTHTFFEKCQQITRNSTASLKNISLADAVKKFEKSKAAVVSDLIKSAYAKAYESSSDLENESALTFTYVENHELNLIFKRENENAAASDNRCIYDSLYIANYNSLYGNGKAQEIYRELIKEKEREQAAKVLLSTLKRDIHTTHEALDAEF
jgi:hypothetical protein